MKASGASNELTGTGLLSVDSLVTSGGEISKGLLKTGSQIVVKEKKFGTTTFQVTGFNIGRNDVNKVIPKIFYRGSSSSLGARYDGILNLRSLAGILSFDKSIGLEPSIEIKK